MASVVCDRRPTPARTCLCLQVSVPRDPQAAEQGGCFSPYPTRNPTSCNFISCPRTHLFPEWFSVEGPFLSGGFPLEPTGVPLALCRGHKDKTRPSAMNAFPQSSARLNSLSVSYPGEGKTEACVSFMLPFLCMAAPNMLFWRKTQTPKENTTYTNGTVYAHCWERDISFINTASISFPTLFQGVAEPGTHRSLTLHVLMEGSLSRPEGQQI